MSTLTRIRAWLILFVAALVISGITAFPLETELRLLAAVVPDETGWIARVRDGLIETNDRHPFILYTADWLAFAHLVIAVAFAGPLRDPVRNVWVVEFAMIACAGIIPLAAICGPIRDIPWGWTLIDISFGVVGIIPLFIVRRLIRGLERERQHAGQP
ncbi:hypothetical protein J2S43_005168 [Catenuloplanes nepalensis]|uniref:Uncharacterized protein n=1 Tax=Catenuloplanes nepalensis TaxID=587533 RepID=A0ABT9N073_9ACTN|nr:hypothetical protein [Catenuloplanes nepalensis]MDP9796656.1 hypothetical protein [Catenuloplanes nepalensis]